MKSPSTKSSLFSFGKKGQNVTPPAPPVPAKPPVQAKASPASTAAPPLTLDDLLVAQLAASCAKEAVAQERFDTLLNRARAYVIAKKD